jgi:hypothetical protein
MSERESEDSCVLCAIFDPGSWFGSAGGGASLFFWMRS